MPIAIEAMASTTTSHSALDGASADKKRNKLGYHRTSVACGHCRRRKIRCLVAAGDTQGRCENCIRLRKECQFFPVDQQPPVEKKSRPSSRLETAPAAGSVTTPMSSSPTNVNAESLDAFYQYPPLSMNASPGQDMSNFSPGTFNGTQMSGFTPDRPIGAGDYSGHPTMEAGVPWDEFTTISDPQLLATMAANKNQMMNMGPQMWNSGTMPSGLPPASPMSAASPMAGHSQPMNQAASYTMQPDGTMWQVPPSGPSRTMSYPGQDMGSSYPNQFQQQVPPDLKRRMTTPAQSISASSQNSAGTSPGMQGTSGSVSYSGPAGMAYTQWPNMNNMSGMGVVPFPMYGDGVSQSSFSGNPPPMEHPGRGPGRSGA